MSSTYSKTLVLMAMSMPLLSLATPIGTPLNKMQKRDGVTCNKSYAGNLAVMNVIADPNLSIPKQTNVYLDDAGMLAADTTGVQESIRVQFDTCTTEGWNSPYDTPLGQFKPEGDNYNCFTLLDPTSQPTKVNVQPCGDYNGGILQNQWFQGQFDDEGGFHVIYKGNPNGNSQPASEISFAYQGDIPSPNELSFTYRSDSAQADLTELQFLGLESF